MSYYENLVQERVNEALREGIESQQIHRAKGKQVSLARRAIRSLTKLLSRSAKQRNTELIAPLKRETEQG